MAQRYDRIPLIDPGAAGSPEGVIELVNARIQLINEVLAEISTAEAETRGDDGRTPAFRANVDMGRNRVTNATRSRDSADCVIREELEEIGLLGNPDGISFSVPVEFAGGVSSSGPSGGGSDLTTIEEVINAITQAAGTLPLASDGELVNDRGYGTLGTTQGTLLMFVGGDGRAQFVRGENGRALFELNDTNGLLYQILEQLRTIGERLGNGLDSERWK